MSCAKDTVLILTNTEEAAIGRVINWLNHFNQKFIRINTEDLILPSNKISLRFLDNKKFEGSIKFGDQIVDLSRIKSVWYRRPKSPKSNHPDNQTKSFIEDEFKAALWSLYTCLDSFWMNDPLISKYLLDHNKMLQMKIATSVGLLVPKTIVTNVPDDVLSFCRQNQDEIAVKVLHSRIFQKEGSRKSFGIYTNRVGLEYLQKHASEITLAPLIAQEYVPKKIELRVTVIGNKVYACAIHSQDSEKTKDDWRRYDFDNVKHEPYELPKKIEGQILSFMKKCRLEFGAIDMIMTPNGEYIFLEVNPNGQFDWIEGLTGMPISKAIAERLIKAKI